MFRADTRILVLDDSLSARLNIREMLKTLGFKDISEAPDVQKAWEMLQQSSPPIQLILSDHHMPEFTGMDLLKMVRSDPKLSKTPFIMVTSEGEKTTVLDAVKAGVTNYIMKPFDTETLKAKLIYTAQSLGLK
jgi:two-component system chemotaxis response regulator CheY